MNESTPINAAATDASSTDVAGRVGWIDTGRGLAIGLVVLLHSTEWLNAVWFMPQTIIEINDAFASIRMPLFFFIAGALGSKWRHRSYSALFNRRLSLLIWVFVVWQPVVFVYKYSAGAVLPNQNAASLGEHLLRMALTLARPNGELWFLWALVIFFLVARLTNRVNDKLVLAVTGLMSAGWFSIGRPVLGADNLRALGDGWDGAIGLLFFFMLGILLGPKLLVTFGAWKLRTLLIIVLSWAALESAAVLLSDWNLAYPLDFIERLLGLCAGVSLARFLYRVKWLSLIGTRTLPIYLAHSAVIVAVVCVVYLVSGSTHEIGSVVSGVAVTVLCGFAISTSLFAYRLKNVNGFGWLYREPSWFRVGERNDRTDSGLEK